MRRSTAASAVFERDEEMQVSKITIDASALAKKLCVGFAFFAVPTYYSRNAKEQGNRETLILHMTIAKQASSVLTIRDTFQPTNSGNLTGCARP